jgi:DNA-binding SARP family transcriptional activator
MDAGQPRQRSVLAALLIDAGRVVPSHVLVDRVWGDAPPRDSHAALRANLTRIRRMLDQGCPGRGGQLLMHRSGGYILAVSRQLVDVHRFHGMTAMARRPGLPDGRRLELLRDAVRMSHGEPLAGLAGRWAQLTRLLWTRDMVDAAAAWARAELRAGDPRAALTAVGALAAEHPLVEPLAAILMETLVAAGRTAEALQHYATVRVRLADELGVGPGPELQETYLAVLRGSRQPAGRY